MSNELHPLLLRQLRKHFGGLENVPESLTDFIQSVNTSYSHQEKELNRLDRTMELNSKELLENNALLKRKNEMLDAFVYRVSHDLKAPINNILSLQMMLSELQPPEVADNAMLQKIFQNVTDTAKRMNVRIADLLDISRIEQAMDAADEEVELQGLFENVCNDLELEIQKSEAKLLADFSQVPSIVCSRENIYSLFSNLLSNSIKYRALDRKPVITVQSFDHGDESILRFADNGMGIDLETNGDKLFGMFNRFHSHVPGTGVGLFIIKKIIEKSGGEIEVESAVDQGTTFFIKFVHART